MFCYNFIAFSSSFVNFSLQLVIRLQYAIAIIIYSSITIISSKYVVDIILSQDFMSFNMVNLYLEGIIFYLCMKQGDNDGNKIIEWL